MTPITRELLIKNGYSVCGISGDRKSYAKRIDGIGCIIVSEKHTYGMSIAIYDTSKGTEASICTPYAEKVNALLDIIELPEVKLKLPTNDKEYYGG